MRKVHRQSRQRARVAQANKQGAACRELLPIEHLTSGEFAELDFLELLLLLQISEWIHANQPEWADLEVRKQTGAFKEALVSLYARRRRTGAWAAGPELAVLRDGARMLARWIASVPEAVVARADVELRRRQAGTSPQSGPAA